MATVETISQPVRQGSSVSTDLNSPDYNIVFRCVVKNKLDRLVKCFDDEEDSYHDKVLSQMNARDVKESRTPLEMSAILGRVEIMKELIARGADINLATASGYTPLHFASCWGRTQCVKILVEAGVSLQALSCHKERAREIALRYKHMECVDYLDWAEAKQNLVSAINLTRETISDPEKVQGRLTRDDKNSTLAICNEKSDWIENTSDATTNDFITQKTLFDELLEPIWIKLNEPVPEKGEKK